MNRDRKKILLVEFHLGKSGGHHREYLHHIYMMAFNDPNNHYYFAVPADANLFEMFDWPKCDNIDLVFMPEMVNCKDLKQQRAIFRQLLKEYKPDKLFFITLVESMRILFPWLWWNFPSLQIGGIVYQIYTHRWKNASFQRRCRDICLYAIFRFNRCYRWIFLLNDRASMQVLNHSWHTRKFHYLTDPIRWGWSMIGGD